MGIFCYGYSNESKQALIPLVKLGNEYGAELFYNFALTKWFRVTTDVQVVAPANKRSDQPPVTRKPHGGEQFHGSALRSAGSGLILARVADIGRGRPDEQRYRRS